MHIRTFRAASLHDALEQIRHQMGPDASVLHTRQVRDGWMGWLGRTYVEVTAGLRDNDDGQPTISLSTHRMVRSEIDARPATRTILPTSRHEASELISRNTPHESTPCEPTLSPDLQLLRDQLCSAGVPHPIAMRWIQATESFSANLIEAPGEPSLANLQRSVARELRIGGPIQTRAGNRHVVALVGPTGVGKTTTVAKLAAGFRIQQRRRVGLLTIDTFRIAAVQQIKAYAEIMDLPMEVVEKPDDMQAAMNRLRDVDLVLIDTAGRSPRSDARIDQLIDLLRTAQPDETHLVLSATSSTANIQAALQGFAPVRPTAAILTKLDESPQMASVLAALTVDDNFAGIPISYVTNGQQVPDDIAVAESELLVSRLLQDRIGMTHVDAA